MPPDHTRAARPAVLATPLVRKLAAYRGVDLASVRGTGAGGRIRHEDVLAQAVRPAPAAAASPAVRPAPAAPAVRAAAAGRFPKPTPADVTSAGRDAALVAIARREGPEPTLFATGDLPPFTASGLAPEMLLQVPWRARHAMAAAPTTADAYAIVEDFAGLDPDEAVAWVEFGGYARHRGNQEFEHRMENWLAGTTAAPRSGGR